MPDYERKAKVIASGLVKTFKDVHKTEMAHYYQWQDARCMYDIETAEDVRSFFMQANPEEWQEAKRVAHSDYNRNQRLRGRISEYLNQGECVFITLTFRDDVLESTSEETRRRYVTRFLKSQGGHFVGNIDYGGKNGREHYHAVRLGRIDPKAWQYGACNVQKVRNNTKDATKLAKYTAKLTNHAIKETTRRNVMIYSRD